MFDSEPFYHASTKKIVAAFGSLFNNISIVRYDSNNNEQQRVKIPLAYGPREKYLVRQDDDKALSKGTAITLPRMSFEITGFKYDGSRKLNTLQRQVKPTSAPGTARRQYQPVPYNLTIDLAILSKYMDDANQILEQILPWFTPDYTLTIKLIPELELNDDISINLDSVNYADNYTDDWKERREIIYTLSFTIKTLYYGPIKDKPIITKSQVDTHIAIGDLSDPDVLATTPRSLRGTAVPDPINAIYTDDYGYTETQQSFDDGKKYNPVTGQDEDI
jgi:hypothetical protein